MTTIWSATCHDTLENASVTVRVERSEDRFDLHIHFPAPVERPDLGPIDVLLRDLTWPEVLVWFDRYRARHGWTTAAPPVAAPRRTRPGHARSERAERPRRTFAKTQPWGRALSAPCRA